MMLRVRGWGVISGGRALSAAEGTGTRSWAGLESSPALRGARAGLQGRVPPAPPAASLWTGNRWCLWQVPGV